MTGPDRRQPGGPVRSIRKNHVLPDSGPTDLDHVKNGYIQVLPKGHNGSGGLSFGPVVLTTKLI